MLKALATATAATAGVATEKSCMTEVMKEIMSKFNQLPQNDAIDAVAAVDKDQRKKLIEAIIGERDKNVRHQSSAGNIQGQKFATLANWQTLLISSATHLCGFTWSKTGEQELEHLSLWVQPAGLRGAGTPCVLKACSLRLAATCNQETGRLAPGETCCPMVQGGAKLCSRKVFCEVAGVQRLVPWFEGHPTWNMLLSFVTHLTHFTKMTKNTTMCFAKMAFFAGNDEHPSTHLIDLDFAHLTRNCTDAWNPGILERHPDAVKEGRTNRSHHV